MANLEGWRKVFSQFNTSKFKLKIKMLLSNCIAGFLEFFKIQGNLNFSKLPRGGFGSSESWSKILISFFDESWFYSKNSYSIIIVVFAIKLKNYLVINMWRRSKWMSSNFFHVVITQRQGKCETNVFNWVCLGIPSHNQN